jgi:hypothetical protein
MSKDQIYIEKFNRPIVFWGMFTCLAAFVLCFLPPLYLLVKYGTAPNIGYVMSGFALFVAN